MTVDGYTKGKRNAHIITVVIFFIFGLVLVALAVMYSDNTKVLYRSLLISGILLAVIMALAMIPIVRRPVVKGRVIEEDDDCFSSSEDDDC